MPVISHTLSLKIIDPRNAKEHDQSFIRKKNTKSVKRSEIITYQPKTYQTQTLLIKISYYRISKKFI